MDKRRDIKGRAKQGANVWGPVKRQEKMKRTGSEWLRRWSQKAGRDLNKGEGESARP